MKRVLLLSHARPAFVCNNNGSPTFNSLLQKQMKKTKMTWEEGMTKCLELYTDALFKCEGGKAIEIGEQMIAIGKSLDNTQKFLEEQNKTYNNAKALLN